MKPSPLSAILTLAATSFWSTTATANDRRYYVTKLVAQQKFDVYNDGHNTYLELIPGLVVTGATADGERYIVNGVPQQIRGFFNGQPITVVRDTPPAPKPVLPDAALVTAQIKRLSDDLNVLAAKLPAKRALTPGATTSVGLDASTTPDVAYGEDRAAASAAGHAPG